MTPDGEETSALLSRLPGVQAFDLELVRAEMRTPAMRRLRFTGPGIDTLEFFAGQDLMVAVPAPGHAHFRRRYTIRKLQPETSAVELEVVLHGDGPGAVWAGSVEPGQRVEALGPRGKIGVAADAAWHLFCGDESALPAIFTMVEALPEAARAEVVLEVAGEEEHQHPEGVRAELGVCWVHRKGDPGTGTGLQEALGSLPLPSGAGHAYVFGELRQVAACRSLLIERGIRPDDIDHKAYWRRGVANAPHGEPQRPDPS
ncbi:MAG: siderophore-interacting protein [Actinomycetota bacterium]|nr:siderophore-interacting protein [Actinomycetota bacterium]